MANYDGIIPDAFQLQYEDEWQIAHQQLTSRLAQFVNVYRVNSAGRQFKTIAAVESREITTRFGDTNPDEVDIEFRWLYVDFKDSAHIIDRREALQLGSATSPHTQILGLQRAAAARDRDKTLVNGILAPAASGKNGNVPIPFPASQNVAVNYVPSGTPVNSGLTFDKLLEVLQRFGTANVMGQDVDNQTSAVLIIEHRHIPMLLREPKFTNADYSEIKRLSSGQVASLLGFAIVCVSQGILPYDPATDISGVLAFARDSVAFGEAETPQAWSDVLPTKKHDVQLRTEWGWGALRLHDEGVLLVYVDNSPPA